LLKGIKKDSNIPVCVSCNLTKPEDALKLMDLGVDRVGIALDAACERVYADAKGDSWQKKLKLIEEAAELAPGRISTHLIVGLGDYEPFDNFRRDYRSFCFYTSQGHSF